jgi:hypothetical protein
VEFWAKDYGGRAVVVVEFIRDSVTVFEWEMVVPIDEDSDGIADIWELARVEEWNTQYDESQTVDNTFFDDEEESGNRDKEQEDPDGEENTDGGTNLPDHKTTGDILSAFDEYRGYILDGGYDGFAGGHIRLSPVAKEFLLEVDAMEDVDHMPNLEGIEAWMDDVADGMGQLTDGIGVRMYYVVDGISTSHTDFDPTGTGYTQDQLLAAYAAAEADQDLSATEDFRHLLLVDEFFGDYAYKVGISDKTSDLWSMYAVDLAYQVCIPGVTDAGIISHELHHLQIHETGDDGGEHFSDTNGNGTPGEVADKLLTLWNYNYAYPTTTLVGGIGPNDTTLTLQSTAGLTPTGEVKIDDEWIYYMGINGSTLTDVVRGFAGSDKDTHDNGATVQAYYSLEEMKEIKYGEGTIQYIDLS